MPRAVKVIPPVEETPAEINYNSCGSKSTQRLSSKTLHGLLAKALAGVSQDFEADITFFDDFEYANECTYSYNNTNWYGIYIIDSTGNPAWATQDDSGKTERFHKLWFEVDFNGPNGPRIKEETATHTMPEFLKKYKQCALKDGKCVVGNMDPVRLKIKNKTPSTMKPPPGLVTVPNELMEKLNLTDVPSAMETSGAGKTVTRNYLEGLSNDVLMDWMINNMEPQKIMGCLGKSSGLTPTEIKKVFEQINSTGPDTLPDTSTPGTSSSMASATPERTAELEAKRDKILNSAKNIGLTEEYFDAVKYYCPTIPGLRIEADGGKNWIRSDLSRNKGWVTRDMFKENQSSTSFGKRVKRVKRVQRKRSSSKQLAVRKKFRVAVKKCKGKKGYRSCMKKLLKK